MAFRWIANFARIEDKPDLEVKPIIAFQTEREIVHRLIQHLNYGTERALQITFVKLSQFSKFQKIDNPVSSDFSTERDIFRQLTYQNNVVNAKNTLLEAELAKLKNDLQRGSADIKRTKGLISEKELLMTKKLDQIKQNEEIFELKNLVCLSCLF